MDPAGINMACVFGNDNEFVAEAAKDFPDRFIPFVYFDPRYEEVAVETVEKYATELGWKGVKVGHQHAVARYMYPMMEKAEEHGLLVVIHSDHSIRNHPYIIGDIANSFPKVNTVIQDGREEPQHLPGDLLLESLRHQTGGGNHRSR
jgi:predicted TIM-barrel fold metal-dependent hydrolase